MEDESYKLRPADLFPYIGAERYMKRTKCNEKSKPIGTGLVIYNMIILPALGVSAGFGILKGLEYLLR